MQLALLSGASPLTCKQGPTVRLQAGTWEISVDGLVDSDLYIYRNSFYDPIQVRQGHTFVLDDALEVKADFVRRGTERYITINVKKVA